MKYCGLYHLNAYTYGDPTGSRTCPMNCVTCSRRSPRFMSGNAGEAPHEDFKVNGQYVNTPEQRRRRYPVPRRIHREGYARLPRRVAHPDQPFFMDVNFMKVHQPNLPPPDFQDKSPSKSKFADSIVETDARIGQIMDKVRSLGLDKNTLVFWTTDNGAGRMSFPTPAIRRSAAPRARSAKAETVCPLSPGCPGSSPGSPQLRHLRRPRLYGDFRRARRRELPENDREGEPTIFDSYDMSPVLFGKGKCGARELVLLHRERVVPRRDSRRSLQVGFNLRGTMGATGGLAVDPISAGRAPRSMSRRCRRSSICGRIRRSATTSS